MRNFSDMLNISLIKKIGNVTHSTLLSCYAYRVARIEKAFSSAFFVIATTAKSFYVDNVS